MADDPHVLRVGDAPTPFTAAEIREGCPPGRTVTTRTEFEDGRVEIGISRFLAGDAEGVIYETEEGPRRVTWVDLQAHASFPAAATTIGRETIATPLGRHRCLRYEVEREGRRHVFWFATNRPGMPILTRVEDSGRIVSTSTLIADEVIPVRPS